MSPPIHRHKPRIVSRARRLQTKTLVNSEKLFQDWLMIWTRQTSVEEIQKMCARTMCEQLGMVFTEIGEDYLVAEMPVDHRTKQPAGLLHGGASVALAETLGSIASSLCLSTASKMPVGVEINANHLKSATTGFVTGKVTPIRVGQSLHVWNIDVRDDKGQLVCVSRLTVMIVDRKA